MKGIIKIGKTIRSSEMRAGELSNHTGVPLNFYVAFEEFVSDCDVAERIIHLVLQNYRVNPSREFFKMPLKKAIETISKAASLIELNIVSGSDESQIQEVFSLESEKEEIVSRNIVEFKEDSLPQPQTLQPEMQGEKTYTTEPPNRKIQLELLRNPKGQDKQTIQELRNYISRGNDTAFQIAAVRGLEKIGGAEASFILTERILDRKHMGVISAAIVALGKLTESGGLLGLTASLLYDNRFYFEKLKVISNAAERLNERSVVECINNFDGALQQTEKALRTKREQSPLIDKEQMQQDRIIAEILKSLSDTEFQDIKHGATLASLLELLEQSRFSSRISVKYEEDKLSRAVQYAEGRMFGLVNLLKSNHSREFNRLDS